MNGENKRLDVARSTLSRHFPVCRRVNIPRTLLKNVRTIGADSVGALGFEHVPMEKVMRVLGTHGNLPLFRNFLLKKNSVLCVMELSGELH